jgi:hypothetical protein
MRRFLRRWALNRADLILGLTLVLIITVMGSTALLSERVQSLLPKDGTKGFVAALFAGWVAILLASLGGAIKITSARQSLISLLSSEIKAIQFGLQKMDMFEFWTDLFRHPQKGAVGFADAPREEKYFEIFHKVSDNIGNLHPSVAEAIVRFYTYLKMSRDAASALKTWEKQKNPEIRREQTKYVMSLLTLSMSWGFVALWMMGMKASYSEIALRKAMQLAYDTVFKQGAYEIFENEPVRRAAILAFFATHPLDIDSPFAIDRTYPYRPPDRQKER